MKETEYDEYEYSSVEETEEYDEILGVDEEIKRNHGDDSDFPMSDDSSESDEPVIELKSKKTKGKFVSLLDSFRAELTQPEYKRNNFKFKYCGEQLIGKPLHEINENKFVFEINNTMKGIYLNEIEL